MSSVPMRPKPRPSMSSSAKSCSRGASVGSGKSATVDVEHVVGDRPGVAERGVEFGELVGVEFERPVGAGR